MWKYKIAAPLPHTRTLEITFKAIIPDSPFTDICLPAWRPGRYEIGNFAKNIRKWQVFDENGNELAFTKTNKDTWRVQTENVKSIEVHYNYYAAQPDAGACWVDDQLIYINPVHCMLYLSGDLHTGCEVELDLPADWTIACSMKESKKNNLLANDFHELVDSPFFAAAELKHLTYTVENTLFHCWFHGNCALDSLKIIHDFEAFTRVQLQMMKTFPAAEYHFLILILPYRFYHGVEHIKSTVLALGPGNQLMQNELYTDLMGIASHELFHAWNVKTLRPNDFVTYDYAKENYSQLGWVYEGFTTYYGDLFLARSKFFDVKTYFAEVNARLQKHFDNYGRYNLSVADSSFDTWLDGYVPGIPNRKTSIYDEGSLIALMLDLYIRKSSDNKKSLDDLFHELYHDFAPRNKGYREQDLRLLAVALSDEKVNTIINLVHQPVSYKNYLLELLNHVGCTISERPSKFNYENNFGFRITVENGISRVINVIPGSPAEKAGLAKDDEIIACNGWKVDNNLSDLCANENCTIEFFSQKKLNTLHLKLSDEKYFQVVSLALINDASDQQKKAFTLWTGLILN